MNVINNTFVLLFCLCASARELLKRNGDFVGNKKSDWDHGLYGDREMNSTVYMSVNQYHCNIEEVEDASLILYGTKSWTFPAQDVNLTMSYPTANSDPEEEGYIITGFMVALYIDAVETKGYITKGGILQDSITLTFMCQNITSLSYQFWLYGIAKYAVPTSLITDQNEHNSNLCH